MSKEEFFQAIKENNSEKVRTLLQGNKDLSKETARDANLNFEKDVELDAYKFLGAYIGSVTGLHVAIILGHDGIAKDIIDSSFKDDLDIPLGGNNTALHLATFLGAKDLVVALLERGANKTIKNSKGFAPIDIVDDEDMRTAFT